MLEALVIMACLPPGVTFEVGGGGVTGVVVVYSAEQLACLLALLTKPYLLYRPARNLARRLLLPRLREELRLDSE